MTSYLASSKEMTFEPPVCECKMNPHWVSGHATKCNHKMRR